MSDQRFVGLAPKSDVGKEYFFVSMDDWIEINRLICSELYDEFPPHPHMDAKNAEMLADRLQKLLDYGIAHAFFVLALRSFCLREDADGPDANLGLSAWPGEDADEVKHMIHLLRGFIEFLRECGGCRVDDCDYGE